LLVAAALGLVASCEARFIDFVPVKGRADEGVLVGESVKYVLADVRSLPPVLRGAALVFTIKKTRGKFTRGSVKVTSPYLTEVGQGRYLSREAGKKRITTVKFLFRKTKIVGVLRATGNIDPLKAVSFRGRLRQSVWRPRGARLVKSRLSQAVGVAAVTKTLAKLSKVGGPLLIANVDHSKAAKSVGLKLASSNVLVFGNPRVGAPLWRRAAEIGIELPLEVMIAESPLGKVYVAYNTASSLAARFPGAAKERKILKNIEKVLANIAGVASGKTLKPLGLKFDAKSPLLKSLGGITQMSAKGTTADAVFQRLLGALEAAPPVNIAYSIEHDKSAKKAGVPTGGKENKVVVFGNPAAGTPLMQMSFTTALDLPAKMGVYTRRKNAKAVYVGCVDPFWIAVRHRIPSKPKGLRGALVTFKKTALGKS